MAVLGRLWVRLRVVKDPGYDDIFVVAAAVGCPRRQPSTLGSLH